MHVLMIGLGPDVLTGRAGDTSRRHQLYGQLCGHLTMIVSAWSDQGLRPTRVSDELMVYPTNSTCRPAFLWDAWTLGSRVCREQQVDLIVTQDPFSTGVIGWLLKQRFKVPLLVGNHSSFFDNPHWIAEKPVQYRIFNWLGKRVIRRADALRVVNVAEREKYLRYGIPPARVTLLPTPVPLDRFFETQDPEKARAIAGRLEWTGKRILLWVGSVHEPVKDLDTLLRAMAMVVDEFPDAVLLLIGDARSAEQWKKLAEQLGIEQSVCFAGRVEHDELPAYYALSEFYVHSSRYEGLAKVMVEAAASARAIVSTAVPGVEAVIENGRTGLLSPVGDARSLAGNVVALLRDPARARQMGACGRELIRARFAADTMVASIVDLWRDVAAGSEATG
jgi:glycosyltransferase involved in cell wall biosynthesis